MSRRDLQTASALAQPSLAYANRPANGFLSQKWDTTDAPVNEAVFDGTLWRPKIGGQVLGYEPPAASGFTAVNQGSSTLTQLNGALLYTGVNDGASLALRSYYITATSVEVCLSFIGPALPATTTWANTNTLYTFGGAFLRESATGKMYGLGMTANLANGSNFEPLFLELEVWSNNTTRTVSTVFSLPQDSNAPIFLRVRKSGTNAVAEITRDRVTYFQLDSRAQTGPFTTTPDQAGVGGFGFSALPTFNVLSMLAA